MANLVNVVSLMSRYWDDADSENVKFTKHQLQCILNRHLLQSDLALIMPPDVKIGPKIIDSGILIIFTADVNGDYLGFIVIKNNELWAIAKYYVDVRTNTKKYRIAWKSNALISHQDLSEYDIYLTF
jgi:hypothetical protein